MSGRLFPRVWVRWLDAAYQDGPMVPEDLDGGLECETIGWLVMEAEEFISVALEVAEAQRTVRHIQTIPTAYIIERRPLQFAPRRKADGG